MTAKGKQSKNIEAARKAAEKYEAGRKGAGGKLSRSEVITVRLDPKLKFAAELAARKQRRTLSSFVEWAIEEAVLNMKASPTISIQDVVNRTWDVDEPDRFAKLAINFPELLTFDEERLWKIICEHPYFWNKNFKKKGWKFNLKDVMYQNLREQWETLGKIIKGEATVSEIPSHI